MSESPRSESTHHDPQHTPGCASGAKHDRNLPEIDLLSPLAIRGQTLPNRIVVSPMCQYSSHDGFADDWHLVHLGSRAAGGAGLVMAEATAVTPEGRITPNDLGIWKDAHIEPLARVASFLKRMGSIAGIQLAHAGRKGSCLPPLEGGARLPVEQGGWEVVAPSEIPFNEGDPPSHALDAEGIRQIVAAFRAAALRAIEAGFQIIEIHAAHGYLLHEFLSPLSNQRTDQFGGSLKNRMRLPLEVTRELRSAIPAEMPLFVRISATDWVQGGWDLEQSIEFAKALKLLGVDLIDTSSGALVPTAKIPVAKNFQVPFAAAIREQAEILTGAVGLITETEQANELITSGACDLVFLAREMLREPYWAIKAQQTLNQEPRWPLQYGYAVRRPRR